MEACLDLGITEPVEKLFKSIAMLKDGTNFTAQMNDIKFTALLENQPADVSHLAHSQSTCSKRFAVPFKSTFGPRD